MGLRHLSKFKRVANVLELLTKWLILDEHTPVLGAHGFLAHFQHLSHVLAKFDLLPELPWCLTRVAQRDRSTTRSRTIHDQPILRSLRASVPANCRLVPGHEGCAQASRSCRCTW